MGSRTRGPWAGSTTARGGWRCGAAGALSACDLCALSERGRSHSSHMLQPMCGSHGVPRGAAHLDDGGLDEAIDDEADDEADDLEAAEPPTGCRFACACAH